MPSYPVMATFFTVLSFAVFLGILYWACSGRRNSAFEAAAQEPFALPDEHEAAAREHAR